MINCAGIFDSIGFDCYPVGADALGINTPLAFQDGESVGFYVMQEGRGRVRVTDNADTLAHFLGRGLPMEDRRRWLGLRNLADAYGFDLSEEGELRSVGGEAELPRLVARYLGMVSGILNWEQDQETLTPDEAVLVDEIEHHLRRRNPDATIVKNPRVVGATGRHYPFALQADNTLIDALRPDSRATSFALRKVLDVARGPGAYHPVLVMDDRTEREKAKHETMILSTVARVLPMSRLEKGEGPIDLAA